MDWTQAGDSIVLIVLALVLPSWRSHSAIDRIRFFSVAAGSPLALVVIGRSEFGTGRDQDNKYKFV